MPDIYFDPVKHKYTDNFNNNYISVTTLIGNYENKFSEKEWDIATACEKIGKNPRHSKYAKYKGKSAKQIIASWRKIQKDALVIGNDTHDYLEEKIKFSSYFSNPYSKSRGSMFTVEYIVDNPNSTLGYINIEYLISSGFKDKYPKIFKLLVSFVNEGWRIFSESVVYHPIFLVAGLIDVILIKGDNFILLDWKTNKSPIQFKSGYYEKDNNNNIIGYIETEEVLKHPLDHLPSSTGIKYSLQTSLYSYMTEELGLKCKGIIICQILHDLYDKTAPSELIGKNITNFIPINYLKDDVVIMLEDHHKNSNKGQYSLFKKYA